MPGVTNIWTQPIRNRIDMLSTGIRTQVGVKVFGTDLATIEQNRKLRSSALCARFPVPLTSTPSASPVRRTWKSKSTAKPPRATESTLAMCRT